MDASKTTEAAVHVERPPPGSAGLSQRLEEKRQMTAGPAMEPFRRNSEPPPSQSGLTGTLPHDTGQPQAMNIVDDDQDELRGAPSPGLGRLDG